MKSQKKIFTTAIKTIAEKSLERNTENKLNGRLIMINF